MFTPLLLLLQVQASNPEIGYRFTVPEGFIEYPEGRAGNADIVDCWIEDTSADSTASPLVLCVQRLRLTMGRDTLTAADVPAGAELQHFRWREFDLQGWRMRVTRDDGELSALTVQVPLRKEAIQLTYGGVPEQEARADSLMRVTLASLEGESNWLTRSQRAEQLGEAVGTWIGALIGIVVLWRVWKWRKARDAKAAAARRPPPARPAPPRAGT